MSASSPNNRTRASKLRRQRGLSHCRALQAAVGVLDDLDGGHVEVDGGLGAAQEGRLVVIELDLDGLLRLLLGVEQAGALVVEGGVVLHLEHPGGDQLLRLPALGGGQPLLRASYGRVVQVLLAQLDSGEPPEGVLLRLRGVGGRIGGRVGGDGHQVSAGLLVHVAHGERHLRASLGHHLHPHYLSAVDHAAGVGGAVAGHGRHVAQTLELGGEAEQLAEASEVHHGRHLGPIAPIHIGLGGHLPWRGAAVALVSPCPVPRGPGAVVITIPPISVAVTITTAAVPVPFPVPVPVPILVALAVASVSPRGATAMPVPPLVLFPSG
eukprot:788836-Prorocentrum_minimum.AAC.3